MAHEATPSESWTEIHGSHLADLIFHAWLASCRMQISGECVEKSSPACRERSKNKAALARAMDIFLDGNNDCVVSTKTT